MFKNGQYFGYIALLANTPYTENAVALTDVTIELINKEDFNVLVHTNRLIATKFMKILSNNVVEAEQRLFELAYMSVRQRVASAILMLYKRGLAQNRGSGMINMLRRDIASIVGTALETLNRTVSDFRDEGLIEIVSGGIRVVNLEGLEKALK